MIKEKYRGHTIEYYDSIMDLPIEQFQAFNLNLILDSGLGGDVEAINDKLGQISTFIARGEAEKAHQLVANMSQALQLTIQAINPEMNAFVCLLYKMDGEEVSDFSAEGCKRVLEKLSRAKVSIGIIRKIVDRVKKNWIPNWNSFSPN